MNRVFEIEALREIQELEESGEKGLVRGLIEDYLKLAPTLLSELELAIVVGSAKDCERVAHSLKSSSQLLGLKRLGAVCQDIETQGREAICDLVQMNALVFEFSLARAELREFLGVGKSKKAA